MIRTTEHAVEETLDLRGTVLPTLGRAAVFPAHGHRRQRHGMGSLWVGVLLAAATLGGCASDGRHATSGDGQHDGWQRYGLASGQTDHVPPVSLGSLRGDERAITVEGEIIEVCKVKGCWMVLKDDSGREVFVRFRDYSFFVPRNAASHRAVLLGDAQVVDVSVEQLQHFAEDAGRTPAEIALITTPEQRLEFMADVVWIEGTDLDLPYPHAR